MTIDVWGLKTCDTCRKALAWLENEGLVHRFRDVRQEGVPAATMRSWIDELGWASIVNTRSTTWRSLPEAERQAIDADAAGRLLLAHPALMKRPLFDLGTRRLLGFGEPQQRALLDGR